jgi:hypothetical protein
MDLTQSKLTRAEWETIEIPVSPQEKQILQLITTGYHQLDHHTNENQSLFSFVKLEANDATEHFLFKKYFENTIQNALSKYAKETSLPHYKWQSTTAGAAIKSFRSADLIRLQNLDANITQHQDLIIEYLFIQLTIDLLKNIQNQSKYAFYLYTLLQLKKSSIPLINKHVLEFVNVVIEYAKSNTTEILANAYEFIEKNPYLLKYEDRALFSHQKELFTLCKSQEKTAKLILYMAPTGTGKTLSPIGLSEKHRIIFVCVARHIGLALAKSAISVEKKVAFAFGAETASDIRLHYFSAINFTKNRKSGGIGKVDNSVGDNVEIMICDVKSYIPAMHYMLAFNTSDNIITYWDEPTITMDYDTHPLHEYIQRNWQENRIPTVVLSCATLPGRDELQPVFDSFRDKFDNAEIHSITSFDCRKSIPILDKHGYSVLPHFLYAEYAELKQCAEYCKENKTLLRYFDLREIVRFVEYVNRENGMDEAYAVDAYFDGDIQRITMNALKEYYLEVLLRMDPDKWPKTYQTMMMNRQPRFCSPGLKKSTSVDSSKQVVSASGILLTTADAYTLTDGPTLFLAEDVTKIGHFYIQQTNIATTVFQNIMQKIENNTKILDKIDLLESLVEAKEAKKSTEEKGGKKDDGNAKDHGRLCKESQAWMEEIHKCRKEIRMVSLDPMYVPNTRPHQQRWTPTKEVHENSFVASIGEETAKEIMMLNIDNYLKVLLLLGIGMFFEKASPKYTEIMKKLADEQRLFMIVASSDYIYGTNYSFCHGFIGKDLKKMTQQKTMQAMGRIGRNLIQQDYTVRFREDEMIAALFRRPEQNIEAENMCRLFG